MARIAYDVSDVESISGEQAPPGIHEATIVGCEQRKQKADGSPANDLHVTVDIDGYARLHSYVGLGETTRWKLREFTDALELKPKGSIDPAKLVGKKLRVKVNSEGYEDPANPDGGTSYRARLGNFLKLKAPAEADEDEDEEEYEEEETEEEEAIDLDSMDRDELKAFIKENNLKEEHGVKVLTKDSDDDLREKIRNAVPELFEEAEEEEEADEDEEEEDEEPEYDDDYDEWPLAELKSELKNREIKLSGRVTGAAAIKALRENDQEEPY